MDNKETNKFRDTFNNMLNNEPEVLKEFINLTFEEYNESQDFNELLCSLKIYNSCQRWYRIFI